MKSNDLKAGIAIKLNGKLYIVTRTEHVKPGKGPAYIQAKIKAIPSGAVTEKRLRAGEDVERAVLDRRKMQYLYSDASGHVFMDNETYDQMAMQEDLVGEAMPFLRSNTDITVLVYKGAPISLELPSSVDLTVTQTTPVVKGATAPRSRPTGSGSRSVPGAS